MRVRQLNEGITRIADRLDLARDYLATSHEFTRLIEDELGLDVRPARADAWIAAEKAARALTSEEDHRHRLAPGAGLGGLWAARLGAVRREVARASAALRTIAGHLDAAPPRPAPPPATLDRLAERLGARPHFRRWADEHRPDPAARARWAAAADPRARAGALCREVEDALAGADREAEALLAGLGRSGPRRR